MGRTTNNNTLPFGRVQRRQLEEDPNFDYNKIIPGSWEEDNFNKTCELYSLTPTERDQLRSLKVRLSDISYWKNEPHQVLWYMKGPLGTSIDATERHFRKMVQWRQDNGIDHLLDTYKPQSLHLQNTVCSILNGEDREGDAIYVERSGAANPLPVLKQSSKEAIVQYAIWIRELHMRGIWRDDYERRVGRPFKGFTIIYDLRGMSTGHLSARVLDVFKEVIKMTKENYSVPVKRLIIIAPPLVRVGWSIVKHMFSASTRKKMIFAGPDDYLDVLDQYVDLDILPSCINPTGHGSTALGMPKMIGEDSDCCKEVAVLDDDETSTASSATSASDTQMPSSQYHSRAPVGVSCKKLFSGRWEDHTTRIRYAC